VTYAVEDGLLASGAVSSEILDYARHAAERSGLGLPAALVRLGLLEEAVVARALAECHDLPRFSVVEAPQIRSSDDLNLRFLRRRSVALLESADGRPTVAMADPGDQATIAALEFALPTKFDLCVATFSEVEALLESADTSADHQPEEARGGSELERLSETGSEAPIIRLVQSQLTNAVLRRASDVHIEPMARQIVVRYRIDGRLVEVDRLNPGLAAPIASRIKVMSALDIAETRLPQDGRLKVTVRGRDVDVRVSTSPTAYGESIVMRLLGRSEVPLDLEHLGLPPRALEKLLRALDRPHGIVLLTGPTGSGKSTTLYAALSRLRSPQVKILTVEDPVEVLLEGVNQVQVRPEIGLDYADTLRAFLRQDPDILMIGEIRDRETADIALRAALTGHLVLSTLHTNSTIGAFTRLTDIGIEPYLAASTVIAVIAQRLIRTLCGECRRQVVATAEQIALFERVGIEVPSSLFEAGGCSTCQGTGYRGRMPLIEVLEIDSSIRDRVREGAIEQCASPVASAETLLGHGLALAAAGGTSMAEVHRAVQAE
jgi:general secretion pathway protein E